MPCPRPCTVPTSSRCLEEWAVELSFAPQPRASKLRPASGSRHRSGNMSAEGLQPPYPRQARPIHQRRSAKHVVRLDRYTDCGSRIQSQGQSRDRKTGRALHSAVNRDALPLVIACAQSRATSLHKVPAGIACLATRYLVRLCTGSALHRSTPRCRRSYPSCVQLLADVWRTA